MAYIKSFCMLLKRFSNNSAFLPIKLIFFKTGIFYNFKYFYV